MLGEHDAALARLREDLAIPYVAVIYSVEGPRGEWVRRAEYPELPGCVAEAETATEAIECLEELRVRLLLDYGRRGEAPPRPRAPLRSGVSGLAALPVGELLRRALLTGEGPGGAEH